MSPPGGSVYSNDSAASAAADADAVDDDHDNVNEDSRNHHPHAEDEDDHGENKSDEGSDPVMVSPSTSPARVESPTLVHENGDDDNTNNNNVNEEDDTEKFVDSIQVDDDEEDGKKGDKQQQQQQQSTVVTAPPPSFFSVGLARKASPFNIKSWIACSLTLDGRDKITKVLQYVCRLIAFWYLSYRRNPVMSSRFTGLFKTLSSSRKAFRLGRSIIELDKLKSMGLLTMVVWYIQQHMKQLDTKTLDHDDDVNHDEEKQRNGDDDNDDGGRRSRPRILVRRASSNIGWGPMTVAGSGGSSMDDDNDDDNNRKSSSRRSLTRSLSQMAYRRMYRPLLSKMSSTLGGSNSVSLPTTTEWWKVVGSAFKIVGLFGFWIGDNLNFLTGSGALDNYNLNDKDRLARRKQFQTVMSNNANRAYFFGAVSGLVTNAYAYYRFYNDNMIKAKKEYNETIVAVTQDSSLSPQDVQEEQDHALERLKRLQQKQFALFLTLLKSCVDVTVFSNNAGIDLHMKLRGKKNHEGLHCICGLVSAGTVLYNNFPDATTTTDTKTK